MNQAATTLEKLLNEMSENIPIIKDGDIFETIKTLYPNHNIPKNEKNIMIEGVEMTYPIATSKKTKKVFIKEKSPLLEMFNELTRGDLLKVVSISKNKIICENISVKKEIQGNNIKNIIVIDKLDILRGDYKLVQRGRTKLTNLLKE